MMIFHGSTTKGIATKGIDYKRYCNKGYRYKGITTKGIATKDIDYKGFWQKKVSVTKGIDMLHLLHYTKDYIFYLILSGK